MKMKSKLKMVMQFLIGVSFVALSACGGSSGGSDDPVTTANPVAKADCVLGTATLGDCNI
jgi:hypothetical protein